MYLPVGAPPLYCMAVEPIVDGGSPLNVPHLATPEYGDVFEPAPVILPDKLGNPPILPFNLKVPGQLDNFGVIANQ